MNLPKLIFPVSRREKLSSEDAGETDGLEDGQGRVLKLLVFDHHAFNFHEKPLNKAINKVQIKQKNSAHNVPSTLKNTLLVTKCQLYLIT